MNTRIIATLCLIVLFALFSAGTVSAHQATSFDPSDPHCMGKLTSFHAQDARGIKASAEEWPHRGIAQALGIEEADGTVKSFQKLSIAWCHSE